MELMQLYLEKMIACSSFRREACFIDITKRKEIKEFLKSSQYKTQGNRLETDHITNAILDVGKNTYTTKTLRLVVAATNPIKSEPYYYAHLAFLFKTPQHNWTLYSYIRGQFKASDLPSTIKYPFGYFLYSNEPFTPEKNNTIKINHLENLKNVIHKAGKYEP